MAVQGGYQPRGAAGGPSGQPPHRDSAGRKDRTQEALREAATAIERRFHALDDEAREHKREADRHRRAAQRCREEQAGLETRLRRLGISIERVGTTT